MILARAFYGFSYGFTIAITTSVFAEITPNKYRGKGILLLNFCVSIGKLYGLLLAYIFLDTFISGNWRYMMIFSCIPNIFVFIGSFTTLQESPRYLIANNKIDQAC
jgi:MFS family permease